MFIWQSIKFIWRWTRRLIKTALVLLVLVVLTPVVGLSYGFLTTNSAPVLNLSDTKPPPEDLRKKALAIDGYQRAEESTFLTYPEWSIVYAAREYAEFVSENRESEFPYWSYIGRYWQDYAMVIRATSDYPFNGENHLMLVVIGTSHTIEHAIQWAWENTIGRATELGSPDRTPEDRFQATTAAEYAEFLNQVPWYRFPYANKRSELWNTETASGWAWIRSWERKLAFGLSYSIKQAYADMIASGLSATSDPALLDIHVWAKGTVAIAINGEADTQLELDFDDDGAIFVTRRYQVFTDLVPHLVNRGLRFVEIGGNQIIFLTVLTNGPATAFPGTATLFAYALPAKKDVWRIGIVAPVNRLHDVLPVLEKSGAKLEHIYDY